VPDYDALAEEYDQHYRRPVDLWEDGRLAELLDPYVTGRDVLDLGCGTGWLLDHLRPGSYWGVDQSAAMLAELVRKHPEAMVRKASVGEPGWQLELPTPRVWEVAVATWAAEYFDLDHVLPALVDLVEPGGAIALHGNQPRGQRRRHTIDPFSPRFPFTLEEVRSAGRAAGLPTPLVVGTSALPDCLAVTRRAFRTALQLPVRWHFAALYVWRL
jgi:predicted TPR repeat methyltransferase